MANNNPPLMLTPKHAAHFLAISLTDDYRSRTLKLWREVYGEAFVREAEKEYRKAKKGKANVESMEA